MTNKIEVALGLQKNESTQDCLTPIYLRVFINYCETTEINSSFVALAASATFRADFSFSSNP